MSPKPNDKSWEEKKGREGRGGERRQGEGHEGRRENRHRNRKEGPVKTHVKIKAEIHIMLPQPKECQKPPETGKGKEGSSPGVCRGSVVLPTPSFLTCGLQNCKSVHFYCFANV